MYKHREIAHPTEMAKRYPNSGLRRPVVEPDVPRQVADSTSSLPSELLESDNFVEALQALVDKFPNAIDIIRFDYHRKPNVTIKNGKIDIQYYWCVSDEDEPAPTDDAGKVGV
jgi:hypothetical protein